MLHPITVIQSMARNLGVAKRDLLVLAPQNDPFNSGTRANRVAAEWFARLLEEHDLPPGKHLRRWHYLLSTLDKPVVIPNGEPYENAESCWSYLQKASSHARYQGLVDPRQFADQRNPNAREYQAVPREEPDPSWATSGDVDWTLPTISVTYRGRIILPGIYVDGYDYDDGDQPYHLECWIEKSTMDAELAPICDKFGVTLKKGVGFDSVTSVVKLVERCQAFIEMDRPIRIFYISDFDPAGFFMPQAIARQIQFWLWREGREADIRLKPLVLTKAQVEEFKLPRKPIKDEDRRKRNFELRLGEGHVELDALAALHPGEFERIVTEAFADFRDQNLDEELEDAYRDADAEAEVAWELATEYLRAEAKGLTNRMNEIGDKYIPKINEIREQMDEELAPLRAEIREFEERAERELAQAQGFLYVDLPDRPTPKPPAEADSEQWLYDSTRTFCEQVAHFKNYMKGETDNA